MRRLGGVLALAFALAAPSPAADLAEIKQKGTLRAIVAADEAPETFALAEGGEPGFERELLDGFARLHGVKIEVVVAQGYADRIPLLQREEGDVIVAIFDTEDRRRLVSFTVEVMPTRNVAVSLAPRARVATLEELNSLKVGVIRGAKPAEEAVGAGVRAANLRPYGTRDELVDALEQAEVAAAILPISELAVASKRTFGLQAGVTVGEPGKVAWATHLQDKALLAAFDQYLGNVRHGPSWSRLIVKYFGDQALSVLGRSR